MKYIVNSLLLLVLISTTIFSFHFFSQKQASDRLYTDPFVFSIIYEGEKALGLEEVQRFSHEERVSIAQYNYLDEERIHIYAANLQADPSLTLTSGSMPDTGEFLAEEEVQTEGSHQQSGTIAFPFSQWDVRYYPMDAAVNVGLGDTFYVNGVETEETLERVEAYFSDYGEVTWESESISPFP
ncbi:hypothetical protein [Sinobaca sp. H24]|uniref:hypothetical protein n=1 Tax=Sinobaca sp. H24 TaxID=2923376 RepID=UPI002079AC57|nr:hypothetical protein [Sinobaca sp. H24]